MIINKKKFKKYNNCSLLISVIFDFDKQAKNVQHRTTSSVDILLSGQSHLAIFYNCILSKCIIIMY